MTDRVIACKY